MLYCYVRVSTDKQTVENQKLALKNYVSAMKLGNEIVWVEETESGTKRYTERKL